MIPLKQVKTEISEILSKDRQLLKPGERNRLKARLSLLKICAIYLETAPDEEFVKADRKRIEKRINSISLSFDDYKAQYSHAGKTEKELKKQFEKEYDLKKLRQQTKALNLLLSNRGKDGEL